MKTLEDLEKEMSEELEGAERPSWSKVEEVGSVRTGRRNVIVVTRLVSDKGKEYVDVRVAFFDAEARRFQKTKKGVCIAREVLSDVVELLRKA